MPYRPKTLIYAVAGVIAVYSFMLYLPALGNGFVNWDDNDYVYENPAIRHFSGGLFHWSFFHFHAGNWHPLTWLSHALDYAVWGLDPFGHHLTNTVLHAINAALVFLLVIELLAIYEKSEIKNNRPRVFSKGVTLTAGAVTGLLFGVHPLHVESVAWIAERKDLLCALFFLLSILSYLRYISADDGRDRQKLQPVFFDKRYLLSLGFFVLAVLSKPMAVSLPVVLLIIDWHPAGRIETVKSFGKRLAEKIPFILIALSSAILTILAQGSGKAIVPLEYSPVASRLVVAAKSVMFYLYKTLAPAGLIPFYPYPKDVSLLSLEYVLPVVAVFGITIACIALVKKQKLWLAVWLFYFITLLPVLGIVRVGGQAMADRYAYLPTLGFLILTGLGAAWMFEKTRGLEKRKASTRAFIVVLICLVIISLSYATINQIRVWRSSIHLWSYVIKSQPQRVPLAYYNRGLVFGKLNQLRMAVDDFSEAIAISPAFDMAYNNRGAAYFLGEQNDEALHDFNKAIELNGNNSEAYINRAYVFLKVGEHLRALPDLKKGCDLGNAVGCRVLQDLSGRSIFSIR